MAIYVKLDVDPANLDDNGIAENQTTGGAANLTLNGALCDLGTAGQFDIGDAYSSGVGGVKLLFDSAGDINTVIFTITGKDENGFAQTETVTGVTTTAVSTTKYWSQVTQIAADSEVTSNVFVGTVTGELATKIIPLDWRNNTAATVAVTGLSGTCQFDIDECFDTLRSSSDFQGATFFTNQSNKSANLSAVMTAHATGVRLKFDSYSNGAELQFHVRQSDGTR